MDPNDLQKKITKNTKAIVPVHLYGNVAYLDKISEIAKKFNIPIIEDSAQSLGSTFKRNILEPSLKWDVSVCILLK